MQYVHDVSTTTKWLAYHWYALPLRHLTVLVDEESRTSPIEILNRWRDRIDVRVWNENDENDNYNNNATATNDRRQKQRTQQANAADRVRIVQNRFLQDCMRYYKLELDWQGWIALVDTDEVRLYALVVCLSVCSVYHLLHARPGY